MEREMLIQILKNCPLFHGVGDELLRKLILMQGWKQKKFTAGETICQENHEAIGVVCNGSVHVVKRAADERDVIMRALLPSQIFGVATLFYYEGELSRIVAVKDCSILFLSKKLMEELFRLEPKIVTNYISFLSGRIHFLNRKIEGFTGYGTKSRLALYFRDNAVFDGDREEVRLSSSLTELAAVLNVGRASLYRALDAMEADGLIKREGKKIILLDKEKLISHERLKSLE